MRMKIAATFLIAICLLTGCSVSEVTPDTVAPQIQLSQAHTDMIDECIAPVSLGSEKEFIDAVKHGYDTSPDFFEGIDYYYRPVNLPEGAVLERIDVMKDYVMLIYTTDIHKDTNDFTNVLNYLWRKSFNYGRDEAKPEQFMINADGDSIEFEGYENRKYSIASYVTLKDPLDKSSGSEKVWLVSYVQYGACFMSNIPTQYSTKDDLPVILEMEKVYID